ncbi:hypothetical protein [Streptomyces sp. B6B3]|uniref:hypothetical protein n=1 Tax=Streptomyces sp. B6B3 TaxID=3153570 RepID=UPI00325F2799
MKLIAPAAAMAAALLLTGCGDDDEGGGLGGGGLTGGSLTGGGGGEDSGGAGLPDADELELETTGGSSGMPGDGAGGGEGWYAHWEADGVTLYTTQDGILYGNSGTGSVCSQEPGVTGSLDWEPVLFSCEPFSLENVTLRLNGDTLAIEWDDRTEELSKVESLVGQDVDLTSLEATILN